MPPYPTLAQIIAHLTRRLGPPISAGQDLLRWWILPQPAGDGVALWMHRPSPSGSPPAATRLCEVWATRPFVDERERCPVVSLSHLDEFINRIHAATQPGAPKGVDGLCPGPEEPPSPSALAS